MTILRTVLRSSANEYIKIMSIQGWEAKEIYPSGETDVTILFKKTAIIFVE